MKDVRSPCLIADSHCILVAEKTKFISSEKLRICSSSLLYLWKFKHCKKLRFLELSKKNLKLHVLVYHRKCTVIKFEMNGTKNFKQLLLYGILLIEGVL